MTTKNTCIFLAGSGKKIKNNPGLKTCYRCKKDFCKGEMIVSRIASGKRKRYHKKCAEVYNII